MPILRDWPAGRIDQIALVAPDLHAAARAYSQALGVSFRVFEVDETNSWFSGSSAAFRTRIAVALAGLTTIEIIQPVSGITLHSEHLRDRGPGLHHVGVHVRRLAKACDSLRCRGYRELMEGRIDRLGSFAYFEAPDLHCIVEPLQLAIQFPLFLAERARPLT